MAKKIDIQSSNNIPEKAIPTVAEIAKAEADNLKLLSDALEINFKAIAPAETSTKLDAISINKIVRLLALNFGIKHDQFALTAIFMLFLKGAANNGTPPSLCVEFIYEGQTIVIRKYDLAYAYHTITGNHFLRRLAEALAENIGKFAEKNGLNGDITTKVNNRIMADENVDNRIPLLARERAWCSSFSQNVPGLEELASARLPFLLSRDYTERFNKKIKKTSGPSPKEREKLKKENKKIEDLNKKNKKKSNDNNLQ